MRVKVLGRCFIILTASLLLGKGEYTVEQSFDGTGKDKYNLLED